VPIPNAKLTLQDPFKRSASQLPPTIPANFLSPEFQKDYVLHIDGGTARVVASTIRRILIVLADKANWIPFAWFGGKQVVAAVEVPLSSFKVSGPHLYPSRALRHFPNRFKYPT